MLEYVKVILQKVSFDKRLFTKELRKATIQLMPEEVEVLREWCYNKFEQFATILNECFGANSALVAS